MEKHPKRLKPLLMLRTRNKSLSEGAGVKGPHLKAHERPPSLLMAWPCPGTELEET